MSENPRKKAIKMLLDIEKNESFINVEMNHMRNNANYSNMDIRFIGELVNGVVKRKITLDYIISKYSQTKLGKISPFVLNVLRIGVYQILFMDKVPVSAAVNESVKIIKKSSVGRLSGYVNAVLRSVKEDELSLLDSLDVKGVSLKYSMPEWIVSRWFNIFGQDETIKIISSLNEKAKVTIRRNEKISVKDLKEKLHGENVKISQVVINEFPEYDYSFEVEETQDLITHTTSFQNGDFYIQDPAASLVSYVLNPKQGEKIIDMCSAPGGKSIFASELMNNQGEVTAFDIYEHKLKLIKENCERHNIGIVNTLLQDATVFNEKYNEYADKIICDVPCSGFGILRKKPDIRYSRKEEDIKNLSVLSLSILNNASKYLKKGGTLVFSTCTIEPEENENVIAEFLKSHTDFSPYPFTDEGTYKKTFYPHIDHTDGFFICRLKKAE